MRRILWPFVILAYGVGFLICLVVVFAVIVASAFSEGYRAAYELTRPRS